MTDTVKKSVKWNAPLSPEIPVTWNVGNRTASKILRDMANSGKTWVGGCNSFNGRHHRVHTCNALYTRDPLKKKNRAPVGPFQKELQRVSALFLQLSVTSFVLVRFTPPLPFVSVVLQMSLRISL